VQFEETESWEVLEQLKEHLSNKDVVEVRANKFWSPEWRDQLDGTAGITRQMPFLMPVQQCKSTEDGVVIRLFIALHCLPVEHSSDEFFRPYTETT